MTNTNELNVLTDSMALAICMQAVTEFEEIVESEEVRITPENRKEVVNLAANSLVFDVQTIERLKTVVEVYDLALNVIESRKKYIG